MRDRAPAFRKAGVSRTDMEASVKPEGNRGVERLSSADLDDSSNYSSESITRTLLP